LRQKIILLIFLVGTQQNQILQSIYFCLPTKNKTKQKNRIPKASLKPILSSPALHPNPSQHHATEVPTKAAATGAVSETGCGTEGIPVATAAATA